MGTFFWLTRYLSIIKVAINVSNMRFGFLSLQIFLDLLAFGKNIHIGNKKKPKIIFYEHCRHWVDLDKVGEFGKHFHFFGDFGIKRGNRCYFY